MPTDGLCYDPEESKYWEEESLNQEIIRVFEVCNGCRMCFKYCDSFPSLFKFVDEYEQDVKKLTQPQIQTVMNDCFQCKLCEVQCPYTPRDKHEYQLDFPKLVHRYNAVKNKKHGSRFRDRFLANVDFAGFMARMSLGTANLMNRVSVHRFFMETFLGIHRKKLLPNFSSRTFTSIVKKMGKIKPPSEDIEAVIFQTCYVENNEPSIGLDTLEVLEKNQIRTACVSGLKCCGMPSWEHGDIDTLRKNARHNLDVLLPYVEKGAKILSINPTCGMVMRREYIELLETKDRADAEKIAGAVMDPGEFLWSIRDQERFNTEFKSTPGESVAYHAPCHLRAQAVGFKGRDLLRKIPGVTPKFILECCGHDGTYAMKKESFEKSAKAGKRAFEGMQNAETEVWSTECPLAAIQFKQHAGVKPMHPMSILARAYKENGFPNPVKNIQQPEIKGE